jgi:mono/diheme cytochrome c family protein
MRDGHVFYIITNGFRKMPSYASQIDSEDRWQVIAYLRTLQAEHQVP